MFARSILTVSIAAFILLIGCSRGKNENSNQTAIAADVAPGTLTVDILEAGRPEHYWQYEVHPSTGTVRVVKQETFPDSKHEDIPHTFQEPAGAIEACANNPEAASPDGQRVAACTYDDDGVEDFYVVADGSSHARHHRELGRRIRGFAWAPNANSVAILNTSSHVGMKPIELLAFISGHPVSHDTVFLDVLDVRTEGTTEYTIRRNVVSSFVRILNWAGGPDQGR